MYENLTKFIPQFDFAEFVTAVNAFVEANPAWKLHSYSSIIEERCEAFLVSDLAEVKLSALDGKAIVALILAAVKAGQASEETILKYLHRLKAIDDFVPDKEAVVLAHKQSSFHRESLQHDQVCGCFHCGKLFNSKKIEDWYDKGQTACCPYCMIDSVVGESCGFEITEEFVLAMEDHWFGFRRRYGH